MLFTRQKKGNTENLVNRTIDGTWLCLSQKLASALKSPDLEKLVKMGDAWAAGWRASREVGQRRYRLTSVTPSQSLRNAQGRNVLRQNKTLCVVPGSGSY